jgi:hypothetical protein
VSIRRDTNFRRRAHFLDSDLAGGILETLAMQCVRPRSASQPEDAAVVEVGRFVSAQPIGGGVLDIACRGGFRGRQLDLSNRSAHRCECAFYLSGSHFRGAVSAREARGNSAGGGRGLSVLRYGTRLRYQFALVLPRLRRRKVLKVLRFAMEH